MLTYKFSGFAIAK